MIPRVSSGDLNNVLKESVNRIENIQLDVNEQKETIQKSTEVFYNVMDSVNQLIESIHHKESSDKPINPFKTFFVENTVNGTYEKYSNYVHAAYSKTPSNLFNLITSKGPLFRDNFFAAVNGNTSTDLKEALKHEEDTSKEIYLQEFDTDVVKLEISLDGENILGSTDINMIEFAPLMPGTFDIQSIELTDLYDDKKITTVNSISEAGNIRIMLDEKVTLGKAAFTIKINNKNHNDKYAFGLRHIYFLEYNIDPASYIIAKVKTDKYIESISEEVFIHDQYGKHATTLSDLGANLFLTYDNGVLDYEIETSLNDDIRYLANNTKQLYLRFPLKYESVMSIEFSSITFRN